MFNKAFLIFPAIIICFASSKDNSIARIDADVSHIKNRVSAFDSIPIKWNTGDTTGFVRDTVQQVVRIVHHCGDNFWECYFVENTRLLEIVTFHGLENQSSYNTKYYYHSGKHLIKHEEFREYICSDTVFKYVFSECYYTGNKVLYSHISADTVGCPIIRYTIYGAWPTAKVMLEYYKDDFNKYTRWHWEMKLEKMLIKQQQRKK